MNQLHKLPKIGPNLIRGFGILLLILVSWLLIADFFDFGFMNNEVTEYFSYCLGESRQGVCYGGWSPIEAWTTYRVNTKTNEVVATSIDQHVERFQGCVIVDRKNWKCENYSSFGEIGFKKGLFYSYNLPSDKDTKYLGDSIKYKTWFPWAVSVIQTKLNPKHWCGFLFRSKERMCQKSAGD